MQLAICDDEKEIRELYAEKIKHFYPDADLVQYRSGEELLIAYRKPDILLTFRCLAETEWKLRNSCAGAAKRW